MTTITNATVGAELRARRERLGASLAQIARLTDRSEGFISRCERGERAIITPLFFAWCRALGLRVRIEDVRGER